MSSIPIMCFLFPHAFKVAPVVWYVVAVLLVVITVTVEVAEMVVSAVVIVKVPKLVYSRCYTTHRLLGSLLPQINGLI